MAPNSKKFYLTAFCQRFSSRITDGIGNCFFKIGVLVASNPWNTIIISILLTGVCSVGLIKFYNEKDPVELWVPKNSKFLADTKWIINHIQTGYRLESVIITAPNVLEPHVLMKASKIHDEVIKLSGYMNQNKSIKWDDVCLKVPFIADFIERRRKRRRDITFDFSDNEFSDMFGEPETTKKPPRTFNPSIDLRSDIYCDFVNKLPLGCLEQNLLELWKFDKETISQLENLDILEKMKNTKISPYSGHEIDYSQLLGGFTRNITGHITSAKALLSHWYLSLNFSEVNLKETGNLAGTEEWATVENLIFEEEFIKKLEILKGQLEDNETKIYYSAGRSFGDISSKTMLQDIEKIAIGVIIMFIYVELVLSKFSWTELRITLGGCGLLSVGLAFLSACGLCSAMGISYGPVHASLPFLLMGLGVDDVFVMMACWRNLKKKEVSIEKQMGFMLKHAGASITVTSLTDIVAFLVGSMTVIPSLRSFCLYAAIGVGITYFYAITFFLACFTLDEYRIKANRNTFLPCIAHKESQTKIWCELNLMQATLDKVYSKCILTKPGKAIIIMTVLGLTGLSIESLLRLEQKFDQNWFIPESAYLHKYIEHMKTYFPESGFEGSIFIGAINYSENLQRIHSLVEELESHEEILHKVDSWIKPFFQFVQIYYHKDLTKTTIPDHDWKFLLSKFLYSQNGGRFQAYFRFNDTLKCGSPTPNITVSWINFRFRIFYDRNDYLPAKRTIEDIVARQNFTNNGGYSAVWSKAFANWITDEIIDQEVYRNLGLALICVMACTVIIIVNIQICFWIFICVLLTLVNVGGFMERWGLTIDLVSCIGLQLAVGLCVDYAAHIGHTFTVISKGNRTERALATVLHIGAAVLYGGVSTLLALSMLSGSEAYTFKSFFKIFLLVIIFGLFHGVVFLPVILSLIGPEAIKTNLVKEHNGGCESEGEELQAMNSKKTYEQSEQNGDCEQRDRSKLCIIDNTKQ